MTFFAHRGPVACGLIAAVVGLSAVGTETVQASWETAQAPAEAASTTRLPDRRALVRQLVRQVLAISRQSPLTIERAVEVLGSRLGPEEHPTPYLTKWSLAPTPVISGGTLTRMPDGIVFQLTPLPALELAFQDFDRQLLDLPYYFLEQPRHVGEDASPSWSGPCTTCSGSRRGSCSSRFPAASPTGEPNQIAAAIYKAYDTAEAKSRARLPVLEVRITNAITPRWKGARSLRERRKK